MNLSYVEEQFSKALEMASLNVIVPYEGIGRTPIQIAEDLQNIFNIGMNYGYSSNQYLNIGPTAFIRFSLGQDFLQKVSSFLENFDTEVEEINNA